MMRPVTIFVGLRYLRSHRSNHFVSFITLASVIGVGLGVAALIVVLSVMNGFEQELRGRLLSMVGHASVIPRESAPAWRELLVDVAAYPGIEAAAPFVELEAMLTTGRQLAGAIVTGVDPELESGIYDVDRHMREGSLEELRPGSRQVILGRALALQLGVRVGDSLTVMVPRKDAVSGLTTTLRRLTVAGVFELGLRDHDSIRALVHIEDAAVLGGLGAEVTGVRIRTSDVFAAPAIVRSWAADWSAGARPAPLVRDWTQDNATYFRAIRIEKIMMTLLLSLIVGVAAFNIIATLVMVVTDKRSGIAILRTMGYTRRAVVAVFAFQGILLGWVGVIFGVIMGVLMALNVNTLAPAIEQLFGFEFMPADVYYLTQLPADLQATDVAWVALIALLLTALATIYPALRAASVAPAEVLRYE